MKRWQVIAAVALNRSTWRSDWRQKTAKEVLEEWQSQLSRFGTREYDLARVRLTAWSLNWVCAVLESTYQWTLAPPQEPYFCYCRFKQDFAVFVQIKKPLYATYLSTISPFLSYLFSAEKASRSPIFSIPNLVDTLHYLHSDWKSFSAKSFGRNDILHATLWSLQSWLQFALLPSLAILCSF